MTNKNEQRKVPELRFPEFSGEWEEVKLKEILKERKINKKISQETPLLAFASGQGVISREERKTNNRDFLTKDVENKKYLLTKYDDIVYNPSNLKYGAIDRNKYGTGLISPIYVTFITEQIPQFIELIVKRKSFQQRALRFEEGTVTKRQSVKPEYLLELREFLPHKNEQQKIGEFFSKLDRQIELEEKKLALLEEQKKGYMQKIFSQEWRFKDENGEEYPEWEENKLRNCSKYKTSNITIKSLSNEMRENLFPVYDANNIVGWSSDFQFNEGYISIIKDGAGVGRIRLLPAYSSILGTMGGITPNHEMIHLGFLYLLLEQINFSIFTTGSTIPHIYYSDYSRVQVPIPSKEEQLKISTFFNDIEQQQNCLKNKIKNLDIQKKELLTKIFV